MGMECLTPNAGGDLVPAHYRTGCCISLAGLAATTIYHERMRQRMRASTVLSAKRVLYHAITCLSPAICIVNTLAVTSPSMHATARLMQHVIVAGSMWAFMELLLLLCYRMFLAREAGGSEREMPGISNVLQQLESSFSTVCSMSGFESSHYIDGILSVLSAQPEIAFWASPPIGCCWVLLPSWPCGRRHRPTARLIALLRRAVMGYAIGAVLAPTAELWIAGAPAIASPLKGQVLRVVSMIESTVTVLALYSLFITYRLSKAPLHAYHTTLKFASVKILVFATPLQRMVLTRAFGEAEGTWWAQVLTCVETPLLSLLLWRAFPPSELPSGSAVGGADGHSDDEGTRLVTD